MVHVFEATVVAVVLVEVLEATAVAVVLVDGCSVDVRTSMEFRH